MNNNHSNSSIRRTARQLVDLSENKRKEALRGFPSDLRCLLVEEMVSIRLERLRRSDGTIAPPAKVSER